MNAVLLGPPGAGKGTQAERLSDKYGWPRVATGDIFRAALAEGTPLGLKARKYMDAGELVPDEVVEEIVFEKLDEDCSDGFILDGFPRSTHQAGALGAFLAARGSRLDMVVNIAVEEDELIRRLTGRRTCRGCGAIFHTVFNPPELDGVCDQCGGELYQRDDDNEETVRNRLEVYRRQTEPLMEYYRPGGRAISVDGSRTPEEVFQAVCDVIDGKAVEVS